MATTTSSSWSVTADTDPDVRYSTDAVSWNSTVKSDVEGGSGVVERNLWSLLLLVFPLATAFGNALVCVSVFTERSLQTVTNYFIVSLAVADLMVALLVMPLAVYVEVSTTYLLTYLLTDFHREPGA